MHTYKFGTQNVCYTHLIAAVNYINKHTEWIVEQKLYEIKDIIINIYS